MLLCRVRRPRSVFMPVPARLAFRLWSRHHSSAAVSCQVWLPLPYQWHSTWQWLTLPSAILPLPLCRLPAHFFLPCALRLAVAEGVLQPCLCAWEQAGAWQQVLCARVPWADPPSRDFCPGPLMSLSTLFFLSSARLISIKKKKKTNLKMTAMKRDNDQDVYRSDDVLFRLRVFADVLSRFAAADAPSAAQSRRWRATYYDARARLLSSAGDDAARERRRERYYVAPPCRMFFPFANISLRRLLRACACARKTRW